MSKCAILPNVMEPDLISHARPSRWLGIAACVALIACCLGYLAWAELPLIREPATFNAQAQSALRPQVFSVITNQLRGRKLFLYEGPLETFQAALFTAWWAAVVLLIGYSIIRRLRLQLLPAESLAFAAGTGLAAISTAVLLLGLAGLITPVPLTFAAVLVSLYSVWEARLFFRNRPCHSAAGRSDWLTISIGIVAALLLLLLFWCASLPPIQSDAMRYHLAAPQQFLRLGRIAYLPHNAFSNFPMLLEMHFLLALAAHVPAAAQMMHCFTMCATGAAIFGTSHRLARACGFAAGSLLPLSAAVLYMFAPDGAVVSTWPNIDHATSLYVLLTTSALVLVLEAPTCSSYILLGLTAGSAAATKYTLLVHLAFLGVAWLVLLVRALPLNRPQHLRGVLAALATCAIIAGPWYLKNIILTHNPVYPLANGIFHGGDWTAESSGFYATRSAIKGGSKTIAAVVSSPIRSTIHWTDFETHNPGAVTLIAWIVAIASVLGLRQHSRTALPFVLLAIAYWFTWFYSYQSNRMLLPFYALLLPCLACTFAASPLVLQKFTAAVLSITAFAGAAWALQWTCVMTSLSPPAIPYILGGMPEDVYLAKSLNYWPAYQYLNEHTKKEERVLLVGDHRIYGARFNAIWSDWFDTPAPAAFMRENHVRSLDELLALMAQDKVHYVLINQAELKAQGPLYTSRFTAAEWQILSGLLMLEPPLVDRQELPSNMTLLHLHPGMANR